MQIRTTEAVIAVLKSIFARHGIPNNLIADNMPFNNKKFKHFAKLKIGTFKLSLQAQHNHSPMDLQHEISRP